MPINIFEINDTYTLLSAIEKADQPVNFLTQLFFNRTEIVNTDYIAVESRNEKRLLAPAIVQNARGVDVNRTTASARYYSPITFAPRRVIGLNDINKRLFGEIPNLYSSVKVEERAAKLQAEDLADLTKLHQNRREQLVSEILQTGKLTLKAYADDGELAQLDSITYDWNGIFTPSTPWTNANADIYGDLLKVSNTIQERAGVVPTVALCGKNVEKCLLNNKTIKDWLMIPNRQNLAMAEFSPHFSAPEVRFIGRISALNMEFNSYVKTYIDENNQVKPYIDDNTVIIAAPDIGRIAYAPITLFDESTGFKTIAAPLVPKYTADNLSQTLSLTLFSRYVIVPDDLTLWMTIKIA